MIRFAISPTFPRAAVLLYIGCLWQAQPRYFTEIASIWRYATSRRQCMRRKWKIMMITTILGVSDAAHRLSRMPIAEGRPIFISRFNGGLLVSLSQRHYYALRSR